MVYEFEELYIAGFIQMFTWWKKFCFVFFLIPFYFIFLLYDIWFIDYEKEWNVDLCLGEKYTYKSWFVCICIIITKVYMVTTWSKGSHTIK